MVMEFSSFGQHFWLYDLTFGLQIFSLHQLEYLSFRKRTKSCDREQVFDGELFYLIHQLGKTIDLFPKAGGDNRLGNELENVVKGLNLPVIHHWFYQFIPV